MKFGICISDDHIPLAASAGFDYVELAVSNSLLPETPSESHITALSKSLGANKIACEALNLMLPGSLRCVGLGVDEDRLQKYFAVAVRRASEIGAKVLVFGSGGQRNIPNSLSPIEGRQQFINALKMAGKNAAKYGIVIAIEPLNRSESNLINSVAEGMELVKEIDYGTVRVLSDLYHVEMENQSYDETTQAGSKLAHVHIAGKGRRGPIEDDLPLLTTYFTAVKAAGYDGRVSIEARYVDIENEVQSSLAVMRRAWLAA